MGHKKRCNCCSKPRFLLKVFLILTHFIGIRRKALDLWMWEMTPLPMGFPSIKQYWQGLVFFWHARGLRYFD